MKESDILNDDSEFKPQRIIKSGRKKHKKKKGKESKTEQKDTEVPQKEPEIKKVSELEESYNSRDDPEECFLHLQNFYNDLKEINLNELLTQKNLDYFLNINQNENIKIDVLLSKIYNKILSTEDIYKNFFTNNKKENKKKLELIMKLMVEPIIIIENFNHCFVSLENFQLKENLLKLTKFIYINLKDSLAEDEKEYINKLLNELPSKFFSNNYLEIIKYKNIIYKNNAELLKNIEKIDDLFFELESYYEQLSSLELLFNDLELDEDEEKLSNYSSISNRDIKYKRNKRGNTRDEEEIEEEEEEVETQDKSKRTETTSKKNNGIEYDENDIISYGNFLLKICLYQKFLLTQVKDEGKNKNEENKEDNELLEDEDPNKTLSLFVIDAVKNVNGRIQNKSNENIGLEELLNGKICISLQEPNNYAEIIKKNINNFNIISRNSNNQAIKEIQDKLSRYISLSKENKFVNINIERINNIQYFSNFSKNGIIIPNRDSRILYIENNEDKKGLLLIEFSLNDEKKDIIFKINKYDSSTDSFKPIYNTGKINKRCKLGVYFDENSLYQIEFDNKYSWLNPKDIDFSISLFRILDDDKNNKEINEDSNNNNENNINNYNNDNNNINNEDNENQKEDNIYSEIQVSDVILNNEKTIKFFCHNQDRNYTFNCNKIYKKIKDYQAEESNNSMENKEIGISILVSLNSIRFITNENGKIKYKEIIDEKNKLITKQFYNRTLSKYLNENFKLNKNENENDENNERNKNVYINLYCQNKNLALISPKIKETISALNEYSINNVDKEQNKIYEQFLQKLGFYPDKKVGGYEIEYNLYDFPDQCLIYHLFLNHIQQKYVESSTLALIFDKHSIHVSALNEGAIYNKFNSLENGWKKKYYSRIKMDDFKSIVDFIAAISDSFDGLDLILCYMDNDEKKDELLDLFKQIKKYAEEKIDEPINVYIYSEDNFISKIFKYIDLFSDE